MRLKKQQFAILFGGVVFLLLVAWLLRGIVLKLNDTVVHTLETGSTIFESAPPDEQPLTILKLEPAEVRARIEYDAQGKTIAEWRSAPPVDEIVMNAGYFHEDFSPSGFLVVNGVRIGNRMFDQNKTGLVVVKEGMLDIRDLKKEPIASGEQFDFALQSYPFLIQDSKPAIASDSGKLARRTAVGIDKEGNRYVIAVGYREISLYELMKELVQTGIPFTYVLNLDGGPSTGVFAHLNEHDLLINSFSKVPSVFRFSTR